MAKGTSLIIDGRGGSSFATAKRRGTTSELPRHVLSLCSRSRPASGTLGAFFLNRRTAQCPNPEKSSTENHRPTKPTPKNPPAHAPSRSQNRDRQRAVGVAMIEGCTGPPTPPSNSDPSNPHKKLAKKIQILTKIILILNKMGRMSLFRRFRLKRNAPDDSKQYENTKQTHRACSAGDPTNGTPRFRRPSPPGQETGRESYVRGSKRRVPGTRESSPRHQAEGIQIQ